MTRRRQRGGERENDDAAPTRLRHTAHERIRSLLLRHWNHDVLAILPSTGHHA